MRFEGIPEPWEIDEVERLRREYERREINVRHPLHAPPPEPPPEERREPEPERAIVIEF